MNELPAGQQNDQGWYEIRLQGHLAPRWTAWFDDLTLTTSSDGTTLLQALVVDQAALHGLLNKLRDIGLPLVSVNRVKSGPQTPPTTPNPKHQGDLT
jgi:hypothetical protein